MKKRRDIIRICLLFIILVCGITAFGKLNYHNNRNLKIIAYKEVEITNNNVKVWDGLSKEELINRLNKNLYHELAGTGEYFADYTIETGLDPYLAVAIINLETGCKWKCSYLARNCYNIGGLKGKPSCNGSSYAKYDNLEDGIRSYLNILYKYYWKKGLTTPEKMNSKYAESPTWAQKVNAYYETIKAS